MKRAYATPLAFKEALEARLRGRPEELLTRLQAAGRLDVRDHLSFEVRADPTHPVIEADGLRYDGPDGRRHVGGFEPQKPRFDEDRDSNARSGFNRKRAFYRAIRCGRDGRMPIEPSGWTQRGGAPRRCWPSRGSSGRSRRLRSRRWRPAAGARRARKRERSRLGYRGRRHLAPGPMRDRCEVRTGGAAATVTAPPSCP